ncbi:MAG TPA: prepilin-type N-terminal cleavage/methylation domain-containing protein [Myxococcota bacterium]
MAARAFSLIEVMIASTLLGIGLAAVLTAMSSASSLNAHQDRMTMGMHLAEARMEELLLLYPDAEALESGTHPPVVFTKNGRATTSSATGTNAPFFSVEWAIAAGPIPRTRKLDVTVRWREPTGDQRVTFTSHRS